MSERLRGTSRRDAGFTLIELMIVVVIVAVLLLVALPMYQDQVIRTYRTTAQSDLMGYAQAMEKEYALNFSYAGAGSRQVYPDASPIDEGTKHYDLQVFELTTTSFTLRAVPRSDSTNAQDGTLYIDHLGQRKWDRENDGDPNDPEDRSWDPYYDPDA